MSDIRKWFMKQHDKNNNGADKKPPPPPPSKNPDQETSAARRKTSKYFAKEPETKNKDEDRIKPSPAKRKISKVEEDGEDDDFERASEKKKKKVEVKPAKKLKKDESDEEMEEKEVKTPVKAAGRGRGVGGRGASSAGGGRGRGKKSVVVEESDDDDDDYVGGSEEKDVKTPTKPAGRGRGGGGRGRGGGGGGGGRGGFMNFGERKDPPHKGEKEVPDGAPGCLSGLTFVISGTLDSLEREEAEDLIKRHGGRVTGSVSKKTNYLLADEDIGGRKSEKAKELGTKFLTEDGLFDMIRKSKPAKAPVKEVLKNNSVGKAEKSPIKSSPVKVEAKDAQQGITSKSNASLLSKVSPSKQKARTGVFSSSTWTEKYKPKVPNEIIGNQSIVKQLHDWLSNWHNQFLHSGQKGKGKKQNDSGSKKAVLLSGTPGIGKSTSAKLISIMLGFQPIEVNASDSRGKADSKIVKGVGGSTSNSIKELINNEALGSKNWSKHPKTVLIMDEVDGMSAGDRGGVADLIASIKISKIPVICICNDRYSQKLKSLVNHCLLLTFRKPTKQQMAKRLMQIATAEGLKTDEIALEELADRVNGDMRMAINQLQYMSLSHSAINYDDIRQRLLNSSKDEDISPFTAVDKLFGFNAGKLRMDERIDLSMSDPDLVPLIIQENYINYRPASMGKDESGVKRLNFLARAAESIGDGDIVNVQIRRYRQWQLSQAGSFASSIIPAALMHGQRETLEPGERNYNRFGGWLGKNSTMGKNSRLLQDAHVHILASQCSNLDRVTLRLDYLSLLLRQLTEPLKTMPKDAAVQEVVKFMEEYSLSQEDFETIIELSKFQGHPNPMEGVQPAVKAALTKAYKSSSGAVRAADLITLPGFKKPPKKRIAAILEPVESVENGFPEENGDTLADSEEENSSDAEDDDGIKLNREAKPKLDLQSDRSKGIQVQLDLKTDVKGKSSAKKTPTSRAKAPAERGSQSSGRGGKRKR